MYNYNFAGIKAQAHRLSVGATRAKVMARRAAHRRQLSRLQSAVDGATDYVQL